MKKWLNGVEIGAGDSKSSLLLRKYNDFEFVLLYEPNNELFSDLNENLPNSNRVSAYKMAVGEGPMQNELFNFGYCSYLKGSFSFIKTSCEEDSEEYWKPLISKCQTVNIRQIDPGNIDYLVLTNNGSELDVLVSMLSRPIIIETKFYMHNQEQVNYYNLLSNWMAENNYRGQILDKSQYNTYYHVKFVRK